MKTPKVVEDRSGDYVAIQAGRITPSPQSPDATTPPKTALGAPHATGLITEDFLLLKILSFLHNHIDQIKE